MDCSKPEEKLHFHTNFTEPEKYTVKMKVNSVTRINNNDSNIHEEDEKKRDASTNTESIIMSEVRTVNDNHCEESITQNGNSLTVAYAGERTNKTSYLKHHTLIHTKGKSFQCNSSDKSFPVISSLKKTHKIHTEDKYECSICEKKFDYPSQLKCHMITHTGEKPHQCTHCGKAFSWKGGLKIHLMNHTGEKPYPCTQCEKSFVCKRDLEIHIRSHTGERPYKCSYCEKSFVSKYEIKVHTRKHTGEKPYQCSYCGKTYSDNFNYKGHIKTHTGEKPYQCSHCGKAFSQKRYMVIHMRTHTGEKPYQCSSCGKVFSQRIGLTNHIKKLH